MKAWHFFLRAIPALVFFMASAELASEEHVHEDTGGRLYCYDIGYEQPSSSVSGIFKREKLDWPTRFTITAEKPLYGYESCYIRHENGDVVSIGEEMDSVSIIGVCRDEETGIDQVVLRASTGQYTDVLFWGLDQVKGVPKQLYQEIWVDHFNEDEQQWGLYLLISYDNKCLWRERQRKKEAFGLALASLGVGWEERQRRQEAFELAMESGRYLEIPDDEFVEEPDEEFDLITRPISAEAVAHGLSLLNEAVNMEGAVYADAADQKNWFVVQILGTKLCDAGGVVLLFDRQQKSWRSIYDVQSGCSYVRNYEVRDMIVEGDQLIASICWDCGGWPSYRTYAIDLNTFHATVVDYDDRPERSKNDELENPTVTFEEIETLLQSGP